MAKTTEEVQQTEMMMLVIEVKF